MITKATRASFITSLQEVTVMITKEDVTSELHPRVQKHNEDLNKVLKQSHETNKPFNKILTPDTGTLALETLE